MKLTREDWKLNRELMADAIGSEDKTKLAYAITDLFIEHLDNERLVSWFYELTGRRIEWETQQ